MSPPRETHSLLRLLAVIFLALLLFFLVICSVKYETAPGKTVEQWQAERSDALDSKPININVATVEELLQLEDMTVRQAERIVEYRERFVRFTSVDELAYVNGISETDVARWTPYIII
ncbi:MAG: helix-hairpin-helix domain-containing protein [Clostridia bacterium]|nr:helix-hairpin-helix domain-containing protein [Clostridia bacterium]